MCLGGSVLFSEYFFLILYVLTAPALTLSSGSNLLLHLYLIYTGYTFIGIALSPVSPFLREVTLFNDRVVCKFPYTLQLGNNFNDQPFLGDTGVFMWYDAGVLPYKCST